LTAGCSELSPSFMPFKQSHVCIFLFVRKVQSPCLSPLLDEPNVN
jgi:hypothetical protein